MCARVPSLAHTRARLLLTIISLKVDLPTLFDLFALDMDRWRESLSRREQLNCCYQVPLLTHLSGLSGPPSPRHGGVMDRRVGVGGAVFGRVSNLVEEENPRIIQ